MDSRIDLTPQREEYFGPDADIDSHIYLMLSNDLIHTVVRAPDMLRKQLQGMTIELIAVVLVPKQERVPLVTKKVAVSCSADGDDGFKRECWYNYVLTRQTLGFYWASR